MKLKLLISSLWAITMVTLQGCDDSQDRSAKGTPMVKEQLTTLCTGDSWQLRKMIKDNQQIELLEITPVTFSCDQQGNVTGIASINRYSGAFKVDDNGTLNWQGAGFIATKMGGAPETMQQEQNFLETLGNTSQGYVKDSILVLESNDGSDILEFSRVINSQ